MVNDGVLLSRSERLEQALAVIKELGYRGPSQANRGDSFDTGIGIEEEPTDLIANLLSNPGQLMNSLDLTPTQAENIASILTGGVAGLGYKFLAKHIGSELAGAVGGYLGAYVSRRVVRR